MEITVKGSMKEIAGLVLAVQGQRENYVAFLAEELKDATQSIPRQRVC